MMMMRGYIRFRYIHVLRHNHNSQFKRSVSSTYSSTSPEIRLTKSDFMRGWRCTKRMYLHKHKTRLDIKHTPPSLTMKHLALQGIEVGRLAARTLFPNGTDIVANVNPENRVIETRNSIQDPQCKIIYEAHFESDGIALACDVIVYVVFVHSKT